MKRLLLTLAVVAVAVTSCQKDVVYNDVQTESVTAVEQTSPYSVSEEEALELLEEELIMLYGDNTRSSQRQVYKITPVSFDNLAHTRSSEVDVDNLLYIVEFADGEGSAILGADQRVESVFAVLEEGVITSEDFNNAANGVNNDELTTYLASLIIDEAVEQIETSTLSIIPPVSDLMYSYSEYENILSESNECLLHTKWGQNAPYNTYCYNEEGQRCVAGCVTIDAAQVLLYNPVQSIYEIVIDGESFNRTLLNMKVHDEDLPLNMLINVNNEVARYVAKLAEVLNIVLRPTSSSGSTQDIVGLMETLGYVDVDYISGSDLTFEGCVRDQLYLRCLPAPFKGVDINSNTGHSWVIDGYKYQVDKEYFVTVEGSTIISREYIGLRSIKKVHCNYGWNGLCDGYYSFGVFDVSQRLSDDNIIEEVGDVEYTSDYNFSSSLGMIVYELP